MTILVNKPTWSNVFNPDTSIYQNAPLFLGPNLGLVDEIYTTHPKILELYDKMCQFARWRRDEIPFIKAKGEFLTAPKAIIDAMINTLSFQSLVDSIVTRGFANILLPFISNSELFAAWTAVAHDEIIHAQSYSFIIRNSFDDPKLVLDRILSIQESFDRFNAIGDCLTVLYKAAGLYQAGLIKPSQDLYEEVLTGVICALLIESLHFPCSFLITFSLADAGYFMEVGQLIQLIAKDEMNCHIEIDNTVLDIELKTERGKLFLNNREEKIKQLLLNALDCELQFNEFLFKECGSLPGLNKSLANEYAKYRLYTICQTLGVELDISLPKVTPTTLVDDWAAVNTQPSPQELRSTSYIISNSIDDAGDNMDFEL